MQNEFLEKLSKDELIEIIEMYSKNWLATDGVWFQSVERKFGMDEAMFHDGEAWKRFTVTEARRIKEFLKLGENSGLDGLEKALKLRFYANINKCEYIRSENKLVYRAVECLVQTKRAQKNMPFHPCKSVGIIEYTGFAREIDNRISCKCLSCYPDVADESCCCAWEFKIE